MASLRETRKDLGDSAEDVADLAKDSVSAARDHARRFGETLRTSGARLEDDLKDASQRFSAGAKQFGTAAGDQIRQHPLAAFGIAFAAGVLLTRALRSTPRE